MDSQFGFLVSQIKQIGGRIFEKILSEKNISAFNGAQGRILYVLWNADGISLKELSDKTGLAPTTLTSMIDRMEQADLVKRVADKADRRKVLLRLTDKAHSFREDYEEVSREVTKIHFADFSEAEIVETEVYLKRILGNLEAYNRGSH